MKKITASDVRIMIHMYNDGVTITDISEFLNINYRNIVAIIWSCKLGRES